MTDLTEQWRKGELPEGYYYVKDGENMIAEYLDGYFYNNGEPMTSFSGGVDKVLAPVPSYEEWKQKDKALTALLAEYGKVTRELQEEKAKHMSRPSLRSPEDEMVIEKQVWESTLHRSMVLQAENENLEKEKAQLTEQLIQAKQSMSQALNYLACMDRISDTEPNEQLAFDVLRKCLEELENA